MYSLGQLHVGQVSPSVAASLRLPQKAPSLLSWTLLTGFSLPHLGRL